jgi:hypothetical protein
MRVFAVLALSAATLLLPQIAAADPAQPEAAPAATATPAAAPAATATQGTAPAAPQQVAQAPAREANGDEIVCKMSPPTTGTRLGGGRECHTAREWNERMKESQDIVKRTQMVGHEGALNEPGGK